MRCPDFVAFMGRDLGRRRDALFQKDVAVFAGLPRDHDGEGALGSIVKRKAVDSLRRPHIGGVSSDRLEVIGFNLGIERVARNDLHHYQRRRISVELEDRKDGIKHRADPDAVGAHNAPTEGVAREMCVREYDLISVPHLREDFQEIGAEMG
jgi:hypothetical protein